MDYLQYTMLRKMIEIQCIRFKPYYRWITFNTAVTIAALGFTVYKF